MRGACHRPRQLAHSELYKIIQYNFRDRASETAISYSEKHDNNLKLFYCEKHESNSLTTKPPYPLQYCCGHGELSQLSPSPPSGFGGGVCVCVCVIQLTRIEGDLSAAASRRHLRNESFLRVGGDPSNRGLVAPVSHKTAHARRSPDPTPSAPSRLACTPAARGNAHRQT